MKLAFLDLINWDYDAAAPFERPMGGSQSALCYLAIELAARGHEVILCNGTTKPRTYRDVKCLSSTTTAPAALADFDVVIVVNGPAEASLQFRSQLSPRCKLVLWTQCAHDQQAMFALQRPEVRSAWDVIACVSQWHADSMRKQFELDANRVVVMRNAIGPAFENMFPSESALIAAKSGPPVLAYTSTPFRGLDVLLSIFPQVRRHDERVSLRVYSSMKVYNQDESSDPFARFYEQSRLTPGVEYVGSLPQPALAEALKPAAILAYSNTFAETSCIAVMEAMAAGMLVVTSELGALSETTMGLAMLTPGPKVAADLAAYSLAYTERLIEALADLGRDSQKFWSDRWRQIRIVNSKCTWRVRAVEWEEMLATGSWRGK